MIEVCHAQGSASNRPRSHTRTATWGHSPKAPSRLITAVAVRATTVASAIGAIVDRIARNVLRSMRAAARTLAELCASQPVKAVEILRHAFRACPNACIRRVADHQLRQLEQSIRDILAGKAAGAIPARSIRGRFE